MEILTYLGLFVLSLGVLLKASDWFIDSAEKIGLSFGISPYVIGVTIIAFGTSLPELATSIASVYANESQIVIGNVVGSNITNILLVLGLVALFSKGGIRMQGELIMEVDMPLLVGSAFLFWFIVRDGSVNYLEVTLLLIGLFLFLYNSLRAPREDEGERPRADSKTYLLLLVGGVLVYFGAEYTIKAILKLSELAEIPSEVIALSIVALGTSLPELVVSITAAKKGKTEMAVGNIMGSNIFNTYAVMGIPRFFGDLTIPVDVLNFGVPFMVSITIIFTVISISQKIPRPAGAMLLLFYGYFMVELMKGVI